jgi:hypothetical protein
MLCKRADLCYTNRNKCSLTQGLPDAKDPH